jgi:hypothetical protein
VFSYEDFEELSVGCSGLMDLELAHINCGSLPTENTSYPREDYFAYTDLDYK